MNKSVEDTFRELGDQLDPNSRAFCQRVFKSAPEIYQTRLRAAGVTGLDRVLDAGCGFGQWTIQLAELNNKIYATDVDENRLRFLELLSERENKKISIEQAKVSDLPFADEFFDGLFCYGVIFMDDWRKALREFYRVLRKGGRMYLNFNSVGWYVNLWLKQPYKEANYDPRTWAAEAFVNTANYEQGKSGTSGQKIISEAEMTEAIVEAGFSECQFGPEGTLTVDAGARPTPFFPELEHGLPGVIEALCVK